MHDIRKKTWTLIILPNVTYVLDIYCELEIKIIYDKPLRYKYTPARTRPIATITCKLSYFQTIHQTGQLHYSALSAFVTT